MNLNTLDLNLLLVFDAVYRTGSTTLAGEALGLTQSAVSNALRRLRAAFDDPLFIKTSQGMSPTPLAERVAVPLREGLGHIKHAVEDRDTFQATTAQRTYVIYSSDTGQRVFLPRLLAHLRREAPETQVSTIQAPPREALKLMAAGEIDLALGFFLYFQAGFYRQKLFADTYVCMVAADNAEVGESLTLDQYLKAPHAVYRPMVGSHSFFEDIIDKMFSEREMQRRVVLRVTHGLGLPEIVGGTDLIVTVPLSLAQACASNAAVRFLPLPFDAPSLDITQQWHERFHRDPGHIWLRQAVASIFQQGEVDAAHGICDANAEYFQHSLEVGDSAR